MKPSQLQSYAERIDRVVARLETADPERVPTVPELADIAALSEYHFQRIFRLMTGESVGEAVRRVRLARSVPEIAAALPITQAAGASGYASSQGYARALRQQAGVSASAARADAAKLIELASKLRQAPNSSGTAPLALEVVSLVPFRLLAIRNVGDYAELNSSYERLFDLVMAQVPEDALRGIYGLPHDDPQSVPAEQCRFDCALAVEAGGRAEGALCELTLGGGEFIRLHCHGDYDRIHDRIDDVYVETIVTLDRAVGKGPLFIHYLDDPEEVAEPDLRADVFLPLER